MSGSEIFSTRFGQRWQRCALRLTSSDPVVVSHPDYLFRPPARNWWLWVKPGGTGLQIIPTQHIASHELEVTPSASATTA